MPPADHICTIKGGGPRVASTTNTSTQAAERSPTSFTPEPELHLEQLDLEPEVDTKAEPHYLSSPQRLGKSKPVPRPGVHLLGPCSSLHTPTSSYLCILKLAKD